MTLQVWRVPLKNISLEGHFTKASNTSPYPSFYSHLFHFVYPIKRLKLAMFNNLTILRVIVDRMKDEADQQL